MRYDTPGVFGRSGHVSELAIADALAEVMDADSRSIFEQHLSGCRVCARRLEAARAVDLAMPSWSSLGEGSATISLRPRRRWTWPPVVGVAVAMAAATLLAVKIPTALTGSHPVADAASDFSPKGSQVESGEGFGPEDLAFQVYINDATAVWQAKPGAEVRGGDRLGFQVRTHERGRLMVMGIDDAGALALCFPQEGEEAALINPSNDYVTLPQAVRVDDSPGRERLVAVYCPETFTFDAVAAAVSTLDDPGSDEPLPTLLEGCAQQELILNKPGGDL